MSKALTRRSENLPFFGARDPFFTPFFDRFFDLDPFRSEALASSEELSKGNWLPAVDVKETADAYVVHAELPGLSKEDIQVTLENNVLRLSGERRFEKKDEKDNYHRIERAYGTFSRSFTLGAGTMADKVKAEFKDGVLTITIPKSEETKPRAIAIH